MRGEMTLKFILWFVRTDFIVSIFASQIVTL